MKRLKNILFTVCSISALVFASCAVASYPEDNDATADTLVKNSAHEARTAITLNAVDAPLGTDYIRGFDASAVDYYEQSNMIANSNAWYDTDGTKMDFFKILKKYGVNTVRLRTWVNPSKDNAGEEVPDGDNTTARTLRMAKRAKKAGLKVMIDFHYSDFWTDPGKQIVPSAWQGLGSKEAVAQALYDYTFDVLTNLNSIGATPDYVQVGNEINTGMLIQTGTSKSGPDAEVEATGTFDYSGTTANDAGKERFRSYLESGFKAVRTACPSAKIIMHVASGSGADNVVSLTADLDYDIIGLSYYPWEANHGTSKAMATCVKNWTEKYSRPVVITECGYYWKYSDSNTNTITDLNYGYQHLVDTNGNVYDDLEVKETSTGTKYVVGSIENQAKVLRHIVEDSAAAGARGFCVWGGEIQTSLNWKYSMFDSNGEVLPSIAIFGVQGNGGEPAPITEREPEAFTVTADSATGSAITVSWTSSNYAKTYSVYYKSAAMADYKEAASKLNVLTYTITGLSAATEYSIKVTAKNMSKTIDATVNKTTAAETLPPGDFTVTVSSVENYGDKLSVTWAASANAVSYSVSYKVSSSSGNYTVATSSTTDTSYTITGLTWGTTYSVKVTATNEKGTKDATAEKMTAKAYTKTVSGEATRLIAGNVLPSSATDLSITILDYTWANDCWATVCAAADGTWYPQWGKFGWAQTKTLSATLAEGDFLKKSESENATKDEFLNAVRENGLWIGAGVVTNFTVTVTYTD